MNLKNKKITFYKRCSLNYSFHIIVEIKSKYGFLNKIIKSKYYRKYCKTYNNSFDIKNDFYKIWYEFYIKKNKIKPKFNILSDKDAYFLDKLFESKSRNEILDWGDKILTDKEKDIKKVLL